MDVDQSKSYLTALIGRTLHVTTSDTRLFVGVFKCTDNVRPFLFPSTLLPSLPVPPSNDALSLARSSFPSPSPFPLPCPRPLPHPPTFPCSCSISPSFPPSTTAHLPPQECNVILAQAYEYRPPSAAAVAAALSSAAPSPPPASSMPPSAASPLSSASPTAARPPPSTATVPTVKADMTSRYVGLIVVPGQHVARIEVEGGEVPVPVGGAD